MDRQIRILVAEEDPIFFKMIEDSLRESSYPYHIEKVSSGGECLRKLQMKQFDILLLDHRLPDGEGLDWLRRFNVMDLAISTIFVTATGDPRLAIEAMQEGVFDYINRSAECAKAFTFVVNRAVEGYSLMVEKVRLQKELIFSIIAVFLFILGLYVSPRSSVAAVHLIMGGEFTLLFWVLVVGVGVLLPLALEVYELIPHYIVHLELREHNPWISGIITTSVLIGGFAMRYIVIYAGQMSQVITS